MFGRFAVSERSTLKWLLATLLIAIPLYPKFPFFNIPGIYVAVRAEDFLLLALGIFLSFKIIRNPKAFFKDKINLAFVIFFIVGGASLLSGIFLTQTVVPHVGLLHWLRRIEYVIPFLAASLLVREDYPRFFTHTLVIVSLLVFLYALGQIYLGFPVISTQNYEFSKGLALHWIPGARLHSTFGGHYDLAAFLVLILPLFWAYFFVSKTILEKAFIFLGIGSSFWLLIVASSRISIVSYFIGVGITLWFLRRRMFIVPIFAVSIVLMFLMGDLTARYRYSLESIFNRLPDVKGKIMLLINKKESFLVAPVFAEDPKDVKRLTAPVRRTSSTPNPEVPQAGEDRSTAIRFNVEWPRAIRSLVKNPLLGTGFSSITLATDNDYLRLLGEAGILGFLAFLLVIVRIWKRVKRVFNVNNKISSDFAFIVASLGILSAMLVNAAFIDVFEASKVALVFWTLMGVSVAIVNKTVRKGGM